MITRNMKHKIMSVNPLLLLTFLVGLSNSPVISATSRWLYSKQRTLKEHKKAFVPPRYATTDHRSFSHVDKFSGSTVFRFTDKMSSVKLAAVTDPKNRGVGSSSTPGVTSPPRSAAQLVREGMYSFRSGDVVGSVEAFDRAESVDASVTPFLWQRGISYYYKDMFQEGSEQFRTDVKVNPLDVEEIVWDIACLARLERVGERSSLGNFRSMMMALPPGKKDRRKIMSVVYSLFRGENGVREWDLANAGASSG
mmetsp:Transcript_13355/g.29454  ORF Transcript_13355/g.29454 Transcript_13355/m.29454 type:complete len:252 (+) Transcript_13355:201-956(+)